MLTHIEISNFKRLEHVSFDLSPSVVLVGPNNSGKSTVFQALCLWEIGVKEYVKAYLKGELIDPGYGVTINRKDLLNSPISIRDLWTNRTVDSIVDIPGVDDVGVSIIPIMIGLKGEDEGKPWTCSVSFTYVNPESLICIFTSDIEDMVRLYESGRGVRFGFLQPMSGISTVEYKFYRGAIDKQLGEGKTAEVLRNICYEVRYPDSPPLVASADAPEVRWQKLCEAMKEMFGAELQEPEFIHVDGSLRLEYIEDGIRHDISSAGRGFLQVLLLFAYMYANPRTVLLLDEPDAHLEVIRQREMFQMVNEVARDTESQLLIASHSEVVLNEAADASSIVALIEHRAIPLNASTGKQSIAYIRRSLTEIGWDKYHLALSKGHVIYLEGSTDLQMLLAFANKLRHPVEELLRLANVQYTSDNVPGTAIKNFMSLKVIEPNLRGLALFDHLDNLQDNPKLKVICWHRRELENYFASPELLIRHARTLHEEYPTRSPKSLEETMRETVSDYTLPVYLKNRDDAWWSEAKLSDDWLDKIFPAFYDRLGINVGKNFKQAYYQLITLMEPKEIPDEIREKLDALYEVLGASKN